MPIRGITTTAAAAAVDSFPVELEPGPSGYRQVLGRLDYRPKDRRIEKTLRRIGIRLLMRKILVLLFLF